MSTSHLFPVPLSRMRIIALVLLFFVLSACVNESSAAKTSQTTTGPIQLYDVHGVFLCECVFLLYNNLAKGSSDQFSEKT